MTNPRATNADLTAKARIRNAALDLYAQYGEDRVSLRTIATDKRGFGPSPGLATRSHVASTNGCSNRSPICRTSAATI